ncbi:MAG: DinB family protein [Bryobacteraceae bacterium]
MSPTEQALLRKLLVDAIDGHHAHIDFDSAVADFPAELRGEKPAAAPHTAWQLLEHLRLAQHDILEFSRNPGYESPRWPEGYWPATESPPDAHAWEKSVKSFQKDSRELKALVRDDGLDLFKRFEHGQGQTLLREVLLVANHNSYHLGQLVYLKKTLSGK